MMNGSFANILFVGDPRQGMIPLLQAGSGEDIELKILTAKNIKEAIKILLKTPIELIVCEYELPNGTAIQLLEALNNLSVKIIPVIILAQEKDEKMSIPAFRKGAKDFLIKDHGNHYLQRLPLLLERILKDERRYREGNWIKKNQEAILTEVSDGIIGITLDRKITFANPAAAMYLQYPFESLMYEPLDKYTDKLENFLPNLHNAIQKVQATNQIAQIGQYHLKVDLEQNDTLIKINLAPLFNELMHLEGYVISFQDITLLNQRNEKQLPLAAKDELTGLLNRKSFLYRLEHTLAYANRYQKKCAILFIDLDGFKKLNDALGHQYGDELLAQVAQRIQKVTRDGDVLARGGADEFILLLTNLHDNQDAGKVAAKINRTLINAFELNHKPFFISASIGISLYPSDSMESEKLIQYADFAMSLAKKRGKNHYQFYKANLDVQAERIMKIANDLRIAIENNQLDLHYHPQICIHTGELVGFEALLRWNHPELGIIPPTVFIPIAEEMGFISTMGQWVLNRACIASLLWKKKGFENFIISINLSIKELQRDDFVSHIDECLYRHHVSPHRLQFEVTESIFAYDTQMIIEKLSQLKNIGVQIAMDDFGTGYSCLSYLKDLPIDVIKIDRSFVQPLENKDNTRYKAIVASIVDLAKRLNIATLAEGVETSQQAQYLTEVGCEYLQGFLIAKPMNFEDATEFLRQNRTSKAWQKLQYK